MVGPRSIWETRILFAHIRMRDREGDVEKETKDTKLWEKRERTVPARFHSAPSRRSFIDGEYRIFKAAGKKNG